MKAVAAIERIQTELKRWFPQVAVDGDVGKITRAALAACRDAATVREIQGILDAFQPVGRIDGVVGKLTMASLAHLDELGDIESLEETRPLGDVHNVTASSFADLRDLRAFQQCKANGRSDTVCFGVGDNGIGKWGHITAQLERPMAALPREVWRDAGKSGGDRLRVIFRRQAVAGILADTMPALANIRNGAGIDLNPAFARAFGLTAPFLVGPVFWEWE